MDKYEYWTGKDLGHKPGVVEQVKFEYSQLGKVFNKELKKDDKDNKVVKYDNDLVYRSVSNFNEISSIDSKLDTLYKFYKDFQKLDAVRIQNKGK